MKNLISIICIAILFSQCSKKATDLANANVGTPKVEAFRSKAPGAAPARNIDLGEYNSFDMANGLKVIIVENHKLPVVSYQVSLLNDPIKENDMVGYVSFAGDMMSKGTKTKTKGEIDEAIDYIGATLNTSSRGVFASSLKKHSTNLLGVMTDVLFNPSFPESEFDKIKKQSLSSLATSKTDAQSISTNISGVVNYGKDHVYGEVMTVKSVNNITVDKCKSYYETYFKPNNAYLIIVGDITLAEAKLQAEKYFGSWQKGTVPKETQPVVKGPEGRRVIIGNKDGAVQSVIILTYPVEYKPGSPDAAAATVMNSILGGGVFSGRLMQNLREDKAYTYGAGSALSSDELIGNFSADASVRNEVTDSSVFQFLYELEGMSTRPPSPENLQLVKNSLSGSFARSLESPQTIANFARNIYKYNLPKDYYETYLSRLEAVGLPEVNAAVQKYIKPNNVNIVVVGNKEAIAEKLLPYDSDGEIEYYDAFGMKLDVNKSALPEGVTGASVISDYLEAIGGKSKLMAVKGLQSVGSLSVMGQNATITAKQAEPDKLAIIMSMNGMNLLEQVMNGDKGVIGQMGQKKAIGKGDPTFDAMKDQITIFEQLLYSQKDYVVEVKEIELVDGENCYKVMVTKPGGSVVTQYYSIKNNLLIKSVSTNGTGETATTVITQFKDYKNVDGIMMPFNTIVTGAAPFELNTKISEIKINPSFTDADFKVE